MALDSSKPDTMGVVQKEQAPAVEIVRDVYGGTLWMRDRAEKYLPRFARESHDAWEDRAESAVLFNGLRRTSEGLAGMVMRKELEFSDDVPERTREELANIDLRGRDANIFSLDALTSEVLDGHVGIFVDMPPVNPDVRNLREELARNIRPFWFTVRKQDVIAAHSMMLGGEPVLSHLRFRADGIERDGKFGEKRVKRIRQYDLNPESGQVDWIVWELREDAKGSSEWMEAEQGFMTIPRIPLAVCHANPARGFFLSSEPPLLDLALENVRHFQLRSDRDKHLRIASVPIPVFSGLSDEGALAVSSDSGIILPAEGKAMLLEPTGAALGSSRDELRDIEQRMAALGLAMLQRDTRAAETAEAKRIDASQGNASLSSVATGLENGLNQALAFHAMWRGEEPQGEISVNRDFEKQSMAPEMVRVLLDMVAEGRLSVDTMWESLVRGEILPPGFDPDIERERIVEPEMGRTLEVA